MERFICRTPHFPCHSPTSALAYCQLCFPNLCSGWLSKGRTLSRWWPYFYMAGPGIWIHGILGSRMEIQTVIFEQDQHYFALGDFWTLLRDLYCSLWKQLHLRQTQQLSYGIYAPNSVALKNFEVFRTCMSLSSCQTLQCALVQVRLKHDTLVSAWVRKDFVSLGWCDLL